MSTKAISVSFQAVNEDSDETVRMSVSADFIAGPTNVYLAVQRGTGDTVYDSYQIEAAAARKAAHFILAETRPFDRDSLEAKLLRVEALAEKWANKDDRFGMGYYPACANELLNALQSS